MTKTYLNNIQRLIKEYEDTNNQRLLIYTILELRICIENIAENILKQYSNVLSNKDKRVWQPPQIMKLLSKYEEHINLDYKLYMGFEKNPNEKFFVGGHKSLPKGRKLSELYNSLGSYLHYQQKNKKITLKKLEYKISQIEHIINNQNQIYASLRDNINFDCDVCGRRNIFSEFYIKNNQLINCQNEDCNIILKPIFENDEYKFQPIEPNMKCECGEFIYYKVAPEKLYMGYIFGCHSCDKKYKVHSFNLVPV